MKYYFSLIVCCLLWVGCTAQSSQYQKHKAQIEVPNFYPELKNFDDFLALQGEPLSAKFNDVLSIKVVYDLNNKLLYFINSPRYRYHFSFCSEVLGYTDGLNKFNADNYGNNGQREYCLANLNYYPHSHNYALEFVSDDEIDSAQLGVFYDAIRKASYLGDSLKLLVGTDYLVTMDGAGKLPMPKVYPSTIYAGQQYQLLNAGVAYGVLRLVPDIANHYQEVGPEDIVITKGTPVNVPVCAGIITNSYQTPLSHINILCHSRNIPSASVQDVWEDKRITALNRKPVKLVFSADSFHIEASTEAAIAANRKAVQPPVKTIVLKYNVARKGLVAIDEIGLGMANVVGNKAAGVGELNKVASNKHSYFSIPEGAFAIPFYYYKQHVDAPAVKAEIDALLDNPGMLVNKETVSAQLKHIRKAIKAQPLDAALLAAVREQMVAAHAGKSFRFRSSSNAEDAIGFSGAGLYDSKTGTLDDTAKGIERAIKAVWASEWDEAPFAERNYYHIDHRSAMMGILCHRNFPDEAANGVAITRNLYRDAFPGFTVNVQAGEVSVVSPPDSVTCEQFICIDANSLNLENTDITTDYITYSNITGGKRVLTRAQITQLYKALLDIKNHFYYSPKVPMNVEYEQYALDVEFKFDRNGKLYVKQARPYR